MSAIKRITMLTVGFIMLGAVSASALPRRVGVVVAPRVFVHRPVYDPFWGPWYPYAPYAYAYPYGVGLEANIRTDVRPKNTEVYVDGYYAGHASDFDGSFKRLHVVPGGHAITFRLEGFRTVTQDVYVRADSTFKMNTTLERLAVGEMSAPVPAPAIPPAQSYLAPES
jgi:PEGA domain